jgi:hypothetical protein
MWILVVVASIAICFGAIVMSRFSDRRRIAEKRNRFSERDDLSLEDIYRTFYENRGVERLRFAAEWEKVAAILKLEPGRLRPEDRFDGVLRPVEGYLSEDEMVDLDDYIVDRCRVGGLVYNKGSINALDDCIRLLLTVEPSRSD